MVALLPDNPNPHTTNLNHPHIVPTITNRRHSLPRNLLDSLRDHRFLGGQAATADDARGFRGDFEEEGGVGGEDAGEGWAVD